MTDAFETSIELPYPIMSDVKKLIELTGMTSQEVILQLLAIALSQESQEQSLIVKSLLDLKNADG